jgi:hypothetical protein
MKTCSFTYWLQATWAVQLSLLKGGVGNKPQGPVSSLRHQQSVERLQNSVFLYHEACLCLTDHVSEAIPLFSSAPGQGAHIIDFGQNIE